jgi:arginase
MPSNTNDLTLLGVPLDLGANNLGVGDGPQVLRYQEIVRKLEHIGFSISDSGDVICHDRKELEIGDHQLRYQDEILRVNEIVAQITEDALRQGRRAVVMGGDHSINLGTVSGVSVALDGQVGLIYFDAHGDMNTKESTLTGNIHGMHLASLMGFGSPELKQLHGDKTKIAKENLLHVGGCDFDDAELALIERENLNVYTLLDVVKYNLAPLFDKIDKLQKQVPNIWISLDLDSIDRLYAPGVGMPNVKGFTYREIIMIAEYVGKNCNVVGIDIVEFNPLTDDHNKTAELGIELVAKFLGKDYCWYTNYMEKNKVS